MTGVFAPDVSIFQVAVDDSFNRDWLIFRVCFNGTIDAHAKQNLAWAVKAKASGKIKGFTGYVVPLSGGNDACLKSLDAVGFPTDAVVMIDAEKWNGQPYQINGDHSTQFNNLATALRQRQDGRDDLVWAYGNQGPDLEVWPHKADWLGWVVASYTSGPQPALPANAVGWQYTDGEPQYDNPNRPHSTPPFGRCDHNVLFKLPEDDVPLTDADIAKIKQAVVDPAGDTIAGELRKIDNILAAVNDLSKAVAAVKSELDAVKAAQGAPAGGTLNVTGTLKVS